MYNQSYEDYLRSVLGENNQGEIYNNYYNNMYTYPETMYYRNYGNMMMNTENLENEYPEIYKIVYPMVQKVCERNMARQMSSKLIDDMTNEIYENVEPNMTEVNLNIQVREGEKSINSKSSDKKEVRETRQRRNPLLNDLIRILILRELGIGRPPFRPRPPFPGGPGMPGGPGRPPMMPGARPPFPRDYNNSIYY